MVRKRRSVRGVASKLLEQIGHCIASSAGQSRGSFRCRRHSRLAIHSTVAGRCLLRPGNRLSPRYSSSARVCWTQSWPRAIGPGSRTRRRRPPPFPGPAVVLLVLGEPAIETCCEVSLLEPPLLPTAVILPIRCLPPARFRPLPVVAARVVPLAACRLLSSRQLLVLAQRKCDEPDQSPGRRLSARALSLRPVSRGWIGAWISAACARSCSSC